jgi:hypothetical protein
LAIDLKTGVPVYDSSNNLDQCNALLNVANTTVASSDHEDYIGTLCKGKY